MRFLIFTLLLWSFQLTAQTSPERTVISNAGGTFMSGNYQMGFTLGESVIQTAAPSGLIVTQGFQQPGEFINPLPIEWLDFKVAKQENFSNELRWTVLLLGNNSHFEIERSPDGRLFETLATLPITAATGNQNSYTFLDTDARYLRLYYRLRQIDIDGQFSLSPIRIIERKLVDLQVFTIYPNPASQRLNWKSTESIQQLSIIDYSGKTIQQTALNGEVSGQLNVSSLPTGTYLLQLSYASGVAQQKFLKLNPR